MPSPAVRQRLPAELWKSPQPSGKSPVPSSYNSYIQAHPGSSDLHEASPKIGNPAFYPNLIRRQFTPSNRKKKRSLPRRGSSDDVLDHSDSDMGKSNEFVRVSVSACSDSESGVSYNSATDCRDLYATDSFKAPAVNVLPLPPTKWLSSPSLKDAAAAAGKAHAMNQASLHLQAFLGLVPAERRVMT